MKSNPDRPMPVRAEQVRTGRMAGAVGSSGEPESVETGCGFAVPKIQTASAHGASAANGFSTAFKGG